MSSLSSSSPVSGSSDNRPVHSQLYLPQLPTDILNLIVPYLVDPDLHAKVCSFAPIYKDNRRALLERRETIIYRHFRPDRAAFIKTVQKCREVMATVAVYPDIIQRGSEFLPNLKHYDEISDFLKFFENTELYLKTSDRIKERRFTPVAVAGPFKECDGRIPLGFYRRTNFKIAICPERTLFIASQFDLEVFEIPSLSDTSGLTSPKAISLYKLDYQFDKIAWDDKRMCLIGEKKGAVTELRFDSPAAAVQPAAGRCSHLGAKVAYVAKRVLKILFVEGPRHAFEGTTYNIKFFFPTLQKTFVKLALGAVGVGMIGLGVIICSLVNPLFMVLGYFLAGAGGALAGFVIVPLAITPLVGVVTGAVETVRSFINLHKEEVFS